MVNSYLAQVTSVSSRNETITVELIAAEDNEANADGIAITTGEGYGDYEEDDYVIVIPAYDTDGDVATGNDSAIYGIAAAEVITGSVTSTTNNSLTVGGTTYSAAANSAVEVGSTSLTEQNVYLDTYGYVVNVSETTAAASNLLYVVRGWNASDSYGDETHYAQVVLTDGTTAVYETNTLYNNPGLYSYTSSRDVYTLTQIYQGSDDSEATYGHVVSSVTLTTNSRRFTGTSHYFADDVQFIAVNGSGSSLDVTVYDGVRALTNASYVYYVTTGSVAEDESGTITTVFVPNVLSGQCLRREFDLCSGHLWLHSDRRRDLHHLHRVDRRRGGACGD